jgi:hypothetical protein
MGCKEAFADLHASQHSKHKYQRFEVTSAKSNQCRPRTKASDTPTRSKDETTNN